MSLLPHYTAIGYSIPEAEPGQLFGKPCFKIGGKAFICWFRDGMVFKLPPEVHREAMALEGAQLFDPSGKHRPMKEWVQVPSAHADKWETLAKAAVEFVG